MGGVKMGGYAGDGRCARRGSGGAGAVDGTHQFKGDAKKMGKGLLEVIEFDAEGFATVKVVEEGGIGLL